MTYNRNRTLSGGIGPGGTPDDDAWLALVPVGAGGASYDHNALQPGDLIVSTSAAWISERIRNHTNSPVSHVGIYIGDGQMIEAVGHGVVVVPLATALEDDYYAAAFRPDGLTASQKTALVRWLRSQVGKGYDFRAIGTLLHYQNPEKWFCSELVFAAFEHIGMPLGPSPSQSSPGDVLQITGVTYLGHIKYPPNVVSQSARPLGPFTPSEESRDAMVSPGAGGMSIEVSVLQIGDLVVTSADSALSAAIRTRTGEPGSHVALYIGDGEVIEAIGSGVAKRSIHDTLAETYYAAAYRYVGLTPQQQTTIRNFALSKVGQPYDTIAIASLQMTQDDSAWFCSELVFEAYAAAGITLGDSQHSTPGAIITMRGFEYLGHLPAAGYVNPQSVRGRSLGLFGEIAKKAVVGSMSDVTWSFDRLDGKWHPLHERWSAEERAAHDAPARPYSNSEFTTTEMMWDLGNVGATIPVSFEYNGHYLANLRVRRPINIDENFLYKLDISADITKNSNTFHKGNQHNIARLDLRITWLFDYEGFTRIFQNFVEDTFTFIEEYRIYGNGDVFRRLSGRGRAPSDVHFMENGRVINWTERLRRAAAQSLSDGGEIDLVDANFEGEWEAVTGGGNAPVISEQSVHELRARQLAVRGSRTMSRTMKAAAPSTSNVERAVQVGVRNGATESEARAFVDRITRSQGTRAMSARPLDATVHLPEVGFFNSWQGSIVKTLIEEVLTAVTPQALLDYCTRYNRTIGLGIVRGAGLGGAFDFGAGIVFAPGDKIGFYGSFSVGGGWNFEASAGLQLTYIFGDETMFSGRSVTFGGTLDASEALGGGGRVILEPGTTNVIGWIGEVTFSVGIPDISAIEATIAEQETVTTLALGRHSGGMIGGLPLAPSSSPMAARGTMPIRHRGMHQSESPWR